jgi:putative transposase
LIAEQGKIHGIQTLCDALGESRATWYRRQKPRRQLLVSPRRLSSIEEQEVLHVLNSEEYRDLAPGEIFASLLDLGRYLCSERTMYRILERYGQNTVRWQAAPRSYKAPELIATRPNEVWSWDITKLRGPASWTYFYLYVILDIFSRYVVAWMIAERESAELARKLITHACLEQELDPEKLTIHSDNGAPMIAKPVAQLMADLGITKTHSRPYCSNDNPFSESAFKTLKYRPDFPDRHDSPSQARAFCRDFFGWYNNEHRHSGIAMLTPAMVHYQRYDAILKHRSEVLQQAYVDHPQRFVRGIPQVEPLPSAVWINKPKTLTEEMVA